MKIEVKFDSNDNVDVRDFLDSLKWLLQLLIDTHGTENGLLEQSKIILQMVVDAYVEALDKIDSILRKRNNTVNSDKLITFPKGGSC